LAFALAGHALGSEWRSVRHAFEYVDYAVVALVVVAIVYVSFRRRRVRRAGRDPVVDAVE
jgi:membrane protein DedA with SNARE-associated domain